MHNDPLVIDLVTRARDGERAAWEALVERYAPLVWSICRRRQLDRTDAEDVAQAVWLRLLEQLDNLRDPAALPGWLATTTKRECYRVQDARYRLAFAGPVLDAEKLPDDQSATAEDELLVAERHAALRDALADLPPDCQRLLTLLIADPPIPYAEISSRLGIAVGSIGPYRSRSLDRLRRHPAIAALIDAETAGSPRGLSSLAVRCSGSGPGRAPPSPSGQPGRGAYHRARRPAPDRHQGSQPHRHGDRDRPGRP
jgi:RNA polymerase sigma factor (sigma-70 family)